MVGFGYVGWFFALLPYVGWFPTFVCCVRYGWLCAFAFALFLFGSRFTLHFGSVRSLLVWFLYFICVYLLFIFICGSLLLLFVVVTCVRFICYVVYLVICYLVRWFVGLVQFPFILVLVVVICTFVPVCLVRCPLPYRHCPFTFFLAAFGWLVRCVWLLVGWFGLFVVTVALFGSVALYF